MSHTEFYSMPSVVTWIFRHLRPLPLNWDLPETAAPAEPVVSPSAEKTAGGWIWTHIPRDTLLCCCSVHLPIDEFPRCYDGVLGLPPIPLEEDFGACFLDANVRWKSLSLSQRNFHLPFHKITQTRASSSGTCHSWQRSPGMVWSHSEPRAARRRFQCLHPERKWAFNTLKWTNFSKESSNKRSIPTSDMHIYFHFLDHFLLIARTCIDD